jgi:hypothetical protein
MALDKDGNQIPGTFPGPGSSGGSGRTSQEIGSPEFAEDRTQVNSLNNKFIFDGAHSTYLTERNRNQAVADQLAARMVHGLDEVLNTSQKLNHEFLNAVTARARYVEGWEYNRAYDLANPIAVGAGANLGAGSVPSNRITDTTGAVAGGAINSATAMATLNSLAEQTGILSTMVDGLAQSLYTANTKIAQTAADNQSTVLTGITKLGEVLAEIKAFLASAKQTPTQAV